ncbi:hypothetical protein RSOLAG1IB_00122 [Rhizoctonia solani AG-1 IB]|uniref:RGS domain-containing protein n=2 Tax=Thanatephorus cucumeris (strain AG1-IB / isolate 7/3/14) TaxID=1108050 RepID=A0A0B7F5X1_THACB|nr:hypothetical protein RSOLAG1IB_00122 [Rhizoctonia solani AG-1 IB]
MPLRHRRRLRTVDERPPAHFFTIGSLRRVGERITHPPPPAKEEHYSWFLAPRFKVPLLDVIEDKHLPPLSRQDFEDFLQHADGTVEYLYFYEWVRNYRRLYKEWADSVLPTAGADMASSSKGVYRSRDIWERLKDCQDRRLKEEFTSAKVLFFENGAPYRLEIDERIIHKVLNIPNYPPQYGEHQELTDKLPSFPNQPEPSLFDDIQRQTDAVLEQAYARFLRLAFCNSGLYHSSIGFTGGAAILAWGLAMWCMGIMSRGRGYTAGSLPVIWFGLWFMLVSANSHCLVVYVTGDSRQLYAHEIARPPPAGTKPPPVYSLALVPNDAESTYSFARKESTASHILPLVNTPTLPQPRRSYQSLTRLNSRRASEPIARLVMERVERERQQDKIPDSSVVEHQLPPPRRTKNLPRASLTVDIRQANGFETRTGIMDYGTRRVVEWPVETCRADSPVYSEENDYGIVISDAFEEDSPGPFLFAEADPLPANPFMAFPELNGEPAQPHVNPGSSPEPLAPLVQVPEYAAHRRRTLLDLFSTESNGSRRGSKVSDVERVRKQWPWPRRLFGPMTLVLSPLVRRAHWVVTMRSAIVASVVTCGLAIGLVR